VAAACDASYRCAATRQGGVGCDRLVQPAGRALVARQECRSRGAGASIRRKKLTEYGSVEDGPDGK
jgi:hypothetical protein